MDLPSLRDIIVLYFNDSELRDLCFNLSIDYENLGGDAKPGKARELVAYCQRHNRLAELEATCRRLRPHAFEAVKLLPLSQRPCAEDGRTVNSSVTNQSGGINIKGNHVEVHVHGDMIGRDKIDAGDSKGSAPAVPAPIKISTAKLPSTSPDLFGRETELALLDQPGPIHTRISCRSSRGAEWARARWSTVG